MHTRLHQLAAAFLLLAFNASASVLYVDLNSANPTPPYTNWLTAATTIQEAVDAANAGDTVLVTNGLYASGGRRVDPWDVTNRLAITKALTVRSVNGPAVTAIQGYRVSGTTSLNNAIRCVLLSSNAVLSGFTLTNGSAGTGNYCNGGGVWGPRAGGVVSNCVVIGNYAAGAGGGAHNCTLLGCVLSSNLAVSGGAAMYASLSHCQVTNNTASSGAGIWSCQATNCLLTGNHATNCGGASGFSTLVNCTVVSNGLQAGYAGNGGGSYQDTLFNSILYGNTAPNGSNYYASTLAFCCTAPLAAGPGNIASPPLFNNPTAGDFHLQSNSPCINTGNNAYVATSTDLDGNARSVGGTVDMGAYEFQGNIRYVSLNSPQPLFPYSDWSIAATNIQDAIDAAQPGETVLVTNGVYQTGGRVVSGSPTNRVVIDKAVTVQSVNGPAVTLIQGYRDPGSAGLTNAVRCVLMSSTAVLSGFTLTSGMVSGFGNDIGGGGVANFSPALCLVTNCVLTGNYAAELGAGGGAFGVTMIHCVLAGNQAFGGGGAYDSTLIGCTLSNNLAEDGGALYSCSASNCVFQRNSVTSDGGAAAYSTLNNCFVASNSAAGNGGGTLAGGLTNCTLWGNAAALGGGSYRGSLYNCTLVANTATNSGGGIHAGSSAWVYNSILYYNSAPTGSNWVGSKFYNSCTVPKAVEGSITNEPRFINLAGGNLRLQSNSPCINAGKNAYVSSPADLDGRPRLVGGTVDIGAFEFQGPGAGEFIGWLQLYGLPTDGTADLSDTDQDGLNNWQEWTCGTEPTNPASALKVLSPTHRPSGITVNWQSVSGKTYYLQRSTDLAMQPAFASIQSNILGQASTTSFTDTNATGAGPYFYRVGVQR